MEKTVDVVIPADARNREAIGRLVSRVLRPSGAEIDAELAAYNAERR